MTRSFALLVVSMLATIANGLAIGGGATQASSKTVWDRIYSEAQATRGREVYRQECAGCHLDSLGGADMAPGLAGDAFLTTWNDLSVGDLFERIRISMPQDTPAHLTRQK